MNDVELPTAPHAVSVARAAIGSMDLPEPPLVNATLLVSELVTNAVVHADAEADDPIVLRVRRDRDLYVHVCDSGTGFDPPERDRGIEEPGGWGLVLVDSLAERWGTKCHDGQHCVWFELPLS